jgi:uncharacterized protein
LPRRSQIWPLHLECIYIYIYNKPVKIEFDPNKDRANQAKHGVGFDEAESCLDDPFAYAVEDVSARGEQRFFVLGESHKNRLLVVVTTQRGEAVRIISAWPANKSQKVNYENKKNNG